jgi:hypothetical protein
VYAPEFLPIVPGPSLFNSGKTPAALICAANYRRTSAKKTEYIDEKVNTRIDTA